MHNSAKGYPLAKSDLKQAPSRQRKVRFPVVEELSDSIAEEDDESAETLLRSFDVKSRGTQGTTPLHRYHWCLCRHRGQADALRTGRAWTTTSRLR